MLRKFMKIMLIFIILILNTSIDSETWLRMNLIVCFDAERFRMNNNLN